MKLNYRDDLGMTWEQFVALKPGDKVTSAGCGMWDLYTVKEKDIFNLYFTVEEIPDTEPEHISKFYVNKPGNYIYENYGKDDPEHFSIGPNAYAHIHGVTFESVKTRLETHRKLCNNPSSTAGARFQLDLLQYQLERLCNHERTDNVVIVESTADCVKCSGYPSHFLCIYCDSNRKIITKDYFSACHKCNHFFHKIKKEFHLRNNGLVILS